LRFLAYRIKKMTASETPVTVQNRADSWAKGDSPTSPLSGGPVSIGCPVGVGEPTATGTKGRGGLTLSRLQQLKPFGLAIQASSLSFSAQYFLPSMASTQDSPPAHALLAQGV